MYKKEDKLQCKTGSGIALLETCYKILVQCLRRRLKEYAEREL